MDDELLEALPDIVALVRRDGTLLAIGGGWKVQSLQTTREAVGRRVETLWPGPLADVIKQMTSKAIAFRTSAEVRLQCGSDDYEVRVNPRGPDRAICLIRSLPRDTHEGGSESSGPRPRIPLERRQFLSRLRESTSLAIIRERPIALAVIDIDGITDISQIIASAVSEQLMSAAVSRLCSQMSAVGDENRCYLGQLGEGVLALVVESAERELIEARIAAVCTCLREPIFVNGTEFHLSPHVGVAVLAQDSASPRALLEHARMSAAEARRSRSTQPCFFDGDLKVRVLARLDMTHELREAIAHRDICLRYVGRHDLATGRLVTWVGYLRWTHPMRGEIRPAEFLRLAESTGLATDLSRAVLACLREDFVAFAAQDLPDVRISFGALRHHVLHEDFLSDITRFLAEGAVPAERLELRIAEKNAMATQPTYFDVLERAGVQVVVDEVGRGMGSLDWLARAPLWGLQLDRAWVSALRTDAAARKACRAGIGLATALGLTPIATGIDSRGQRDVLLALGCTCGSGDFFPSVTANLAQRTTMVAAL